MVIKNEFGTFKFQVTYFSYLSNIYNIGGST